MNEGSKPFQIVTWQDFDDFWRDLESSHAETPYTFDAYDEEVARIAFKAGRESMRRQVVAMVEHLLASGRIEPSRTDSSPKPAVAEIGRAVLLGLVDDFSTLTRVEDN